MSGVFRNMSAGARYRDGARSGGAYDFGETISVRVELPLNVELVLAVRAVLERVVGVEHLEVAIVSVRPERKATAEAGRVGRVREPVLLGAEDRAHPDGADEIADLAHDRGLVRDDRRRDRRRDRRGPCGGP